MNIQTICLNAKITIHLSPSGNTHCKCRHIYTELWVYYVCLLNDDWAGVNWPLQDCPLVFSTYPSLQEQAKLPTVLVQFCSHGDNEHSLLSVSCIQWLANVITLSIVYCIGIYAVYLVNVKFGELECKCKLVEI